MPRKLTVSPMIEEVGQKALLGYLEEPGDLTKTALKAREAQLDFERRTPVQLELREEN